MLTRKDAETLSRSTARAPAGRNAVRPDLAAVLALQRTVGNQAVAAALHGDRRAVAPASPSGAAAAWPVVQRKLNPLDAADKPGRLPNTEAESVVKLLAGNGFSLNERQKARSRADHSADLDVRHGQVLAVEGRFKANISADKRRRLRVELADVYDRMLDAAARYRDDATAAHDAAVEARVDLIRTQTADNQLYKGGAKIWNATAKAAIDDAVVGPRLKGFTTVEAFQNAVFARYNAKFKPGAAPAVSGLSAADTLALQAEQAAVKTALTAWKTKRYNDPGCNPNGTWGTCATGPGPGWNPSHLNVRVWAALATWWRAKSNAYITPSDTTTYSLKKSRTLGKADDRSPTLNYHVYVP